MINHAGKWALRIQASGEMGAADTRLSTRGKFHFDTRNSRQYSLRLLQSWRAAHCTGRRARNIIRGRRQLEG
jgi:hypothetical protein